MYFYPKNRRILIKQVGCPKGEEHQREDGIYLPPSKNNEKQEDNMFFVIDIDDAVNLKLKKGDIIVVEENMIETTTLIDKDDIKNEFFTILENYVKGIVNEIE